MTRATPPAAVARMLLTGPVRPGQGHRVGIDAMAGLKDPSPRPTICRRGRTHPKVVFLEANLYRGHVDCAARGRRSRRVGRPLTPPTGTSVRLTHLIQDPPSSANRRPHVTRSPQVSSVRRSCGPAGHGGDGVSLTPWSCSPAGLARRSRTATPTLSAMPARVLTSPGLVSRWSARRLASAPPQLASVAGSTRSSLIGCSKIEALTHAQALPVLTSSRQASPTWNE